MANYCDNNLYITGDPEQLARFIEKARGPKTDLSLQSIKPMPEDLRYANISSQSEEESHWLHESYGAAAAFNWRMINWGTGREISISCLDVNEDGSAVYHFRTAWEPIGARLLRTITSEFPGLKAEVRYAEPGRCFSGLTISRNGWITEESREPYDPMEDKDE